MRFILREVSIGCQPMAGKRETSDMLQDPGVVDYAVDGYTE